MRQILGISSSTYYNNNNSREGNVWQMLLDEIIVLLNEILNKSSLDSSGLKRTGLKTTASY